MLIHTLIVEDDPITQAALRETLDGDDFHTTCVGTAIEASIAMQRASFDAMVLDLSLPDSSPRQTIQRGRVWAKLIPIVILSGHLPDDERELVNAEFHAVMEKRDAFFPVARAALRATIHSAVLHRERIRALTGQRAGLVRVSNALASLDRLLARA